MLYTLKISIETINAEKSEFTFEDAMNFVSEEALVEA
jgi:hypothetical protein